MSDVASIEQVIAPLTTEIKSLREEVSKLRREQDRKASRWCRGDREGAAYVGFSINTFKKWAEKWKVYPRIEDGLNMWDKNDLDKAANKAKKGLKR